MLGFESLARNGQIPPLILHDINALSTSWESLWPSPRVGHVVPHWLLLPHSPWLSPVWTGGQSGLGQLPKELAPSSNVHFLLFTVVIAIYFLFYLSYKLAIAITKCIYQYRAVKKIFLKIFFWSFFYLTYSYNSVHSAI